jgi:hypothetical protein
MPKECALPGCHNLCDLSKILCSICKEQSRRRLEEIQEAEKSMCPILLKLSTQDGVLPLDSALKVIEETLSSLKGSDPKVLEQLLLYVQFQLGEKVDEFRGIETHQINTMLRETFSREIELASASIDKKDFDSAEGHCRRSLVYTERFEKLDEESSAIFKVESFRLHYLLRCRQGRLSEAVTFTEKAYSIYALVYNPAHPKVRAVASWSN